MSELETHHTRFISLDFLTQRALETREFFTATLIQLSRIGWCCSEFSLLLSSQIDDSQDAASNPEHAHGTRQQSNLHYKTHWTSSCIRRTHQLASI